MNLISLFIISVFSGNIVLTKFLGMCSFLGTSNKKKKRYLYGNISHNCNYFIKYYYILCK